MLTCKISGMKVIGNHGLNSSLLACMKSLGKQRLPPEPLFNYESLIALLSQGHSDEHQAQALYCLSSFINDRL